MNGRHLQTLGLGILALGTAVMTASAQTPQRDSGSKNVPFSQLPVAAQNAIRANAGSAHLDRIDVLTAGVTTNYHVAFKIDGAPAELWVDPAGRILPGSATQKPSPARAPLAAATKVKSDE